MWKVHIDLDSIYFDTHFQCSGLPRGSQRKVKFIPAFVVTLFRGLKNNRWIRLSHMAWNYQQFHVVQPLNVRHGQHLMETETLVLQDFQGGENTPEWKSPRLPGWIETRVGFQTWRMSMVCTCRKSLARVLLEAGEDVEDWAGRELSAVSCRGFMHGELEQNRVAWREMGVWSSSLLVGRMGNLTGTVSGCQGKSRCLAGVWELSCDA